MHDLLPAYLDGELDATDSRAFDDHLTQCADCARELAKLRELRAALQDESFRFSPPTVLTGKIQTALSAERKIRIPTHRPWTTWLAAASVLIGIGLAGAGMTLILRAPSADDRMIAELASGHARSLLADHLFDVAASDQHTVKPWFQGKIDFAPPVKDLKEQGFALAGGRLDYLDGHTAAALVYRRRQHVINLFVWPANEAGDSTVRDLSRRGYQMAHWIAGGLNFWAVSDLNADELGEFARLVRGESP
jgi:anti-sigma factor RsiW